MEKANAVNLFKVGQLAEMKTFEKGYRGAWFGCKISAVMFKKNKIKLEYYDFDLEEISWVKIYEVPPYARRAKPSERELMLRPQYPPIHHKSEMPAANSLSQECVVIDGTWKVGDLVDWFTDGCYWSAKVIEVFSDHTVRLELPMPPVGERKDGDKLIASFTDLRPSLDWSETKGWTLPTSADSRTSSRVQLLFPSKQDVLNMDLEVEKAPLNASSSSTTRISAERESSDLVDTPICKEPVQSEDDVKMDDDFVESSNSISSLRVEEDDVDYNRRTDLNIMHQDTLEAAVVDLEELVNKVKWIKTILHTGQSPGNHAPSWKFT